MTPQQDVIVAAAQRWLGTPYHHAADVLGVGVDCAMLIVRVYCDLGLAPAIDPRPYPRDWHLHRSEERFLGWIKQYAEPVDVPAAGDVALFRYGRCVSHGGIVESTDSEIVMIHASLTARCVERAEVRAWPDRFKGFWRVSA